MKLLDTQQTVETLPNFSTSMDMGKPNMEGVEIKPTDVLCGRGKNSFNHCGNRKFRDIVAEAIPGYVTATSRATKSEIVTYIVRKVRESGGRFLKRDNQRKVWYVLNYTQSKEKAGHAIRDATITEESKKQRAQKRKLMRAAAAGVNQRIPVDPPASPVTPTTTTSMTVAPVTPDTSDTSDAEEEAQALLKDMTYDIKSLDDETKPTECLSSMLMAHMPEKLFPEETPSSFSFEPLPIDDPFNSYIDQLLGPLTGLEPIAELADF